MQQATMNDVRVVPEAELVQRLLAREELAMTIFYRQYHRALYAAIYRLVRQPALAQDVLQECLVKVWAAFPSYDARKGRLFTWVLRIGSNLAIDALRRQRLVTERVYPLDDEASNQWAAPVTFWPEHIGVREWLALLPAGEQELMNLLYLQGYTQVEAAQALHLPLGTVKSRAGRSLRRLAQVVT
jgi:RNA polymerase sigma factor (sigma-70 family)